MTLRAGSLGATESAVKSGAGLSAAADVLRGVPQLTHTLSSFSVQILSVWVTFAPPTASLLCAACPARNYPPLPC